MLFLASMPLLGEKYYNYNLQWSPLKRVGANLWLHGTESVNNIYLYINSSFLIWKYLSIFMSGSTFGLGIPKWFIRLIWKLVGLSNASNFTLRVRGKIKQNWASSIDSHYNWIRFYFWPMDSWTTYPILIEIGQITTHSFEVVLQIDFKVMGVRGVRAVGRSWVKLKFPQTL